MSVLDRRDFLGSLLGFASVSGFAGATTLVEAASLHTVTGDAVLVLYREGISESAAFASAWAAAGFATQALAADVVRQWRDGLGRQSGEQQRLLVGLGNWDDQVLLQGLAAEQRRHPLLVMQHPLKAQQLNWAVAHARELQILLQQASLSEQEHALQTLAQRSTLQPGTPSLFSWILG
jgi:hypothetical protein